MEDLKYWIGFNRIPGIGRAKFVLLEQHFGNLDAAWHATSSELKRAGLEQRSINAITTRRSSIDPDAELERLRGRNIQVLTWRDSSFPSSLKEIYDVPPILYILGSLLQEDQRSVAVVGTRKATAYGREAAYGLSSDLARNGVTVVSGLARGIDGIAHRAALEAGGRTIAVLASGLDTIYPREHAQLAEEIISHGALISEYPLGVRPDAQNFPRRNRIMSGMTLGTLVIEAGEVSGAMWTVRHALEQDREVFAVPGSIFSPASQGTNHLIQEGAKLVTNYMDILEELNLSVVTQQLEMKVLIPKDETESQILRYITYEPVHIDEIIRRSGLAIPTVSSTLSMLEVQGLVRQVGAMNYVRLKETVADYESAVR